MNKRRISAQLLLYFFMMMFLMVTVGCSGNFDEPPEKTYVITFDSQDATVAANPTSKTVKCTNWSGCTVGLVGTLPTEPTRTHYAFLGWITEPDCTGIDVTSPFTMFTSVTPFTMVTEDITFYACWQSSYTVTFDSQGATVAANPTSQKVLISPERTETVGTLPTRPTRTGFTFAGWTTGPDCTGIAVTPFTIVTEDITVYACWNNFYTVTFDSQGATVAADPTSKEVIISPDGTGTVDTLPTQPTRTGFTFAGWWTGKGGTGQELTAGDIIPVSFTVYAYWIPEGTK
jgi:uncharacterized repeat protein (TIGR02543 family)